MEIFQRKSIPNPETNQLQTILSDIDKAYQSVASSFHTHFKNMFDLSLHTSLMIKDKYLKSLYNDIDLFTFIDDAVRHRIGTRTNRPSKNNFIYSMNDPYLLTESLDDILYKIMYSAYPVEILSKLKDALENYIKDDRIIDIVLSKLEVDMK